MSAAATAAGYLYASGRLRGRNGREGDEASREEKPRGHADSNAGHEKPRLKRREPLKVAVIPEPEAAAPAPRDKPAPKIQYRTRRWKPE